MTDFTGKRFIFRAFLSAAAQVRSYLEVLQHHPRPHNAPAADDSLHCTDLKLNSNCRIHCVEASTKLSLAQPLCRPQPGWQHTAVASDSMWTHTVCCAVKQGLSCYSVPPLLCFLCGDTIELNQPIYNKISSGSLRRRPARENKKLRGPHRTTSPVVEVETVFTSELRVWSQCGGQFDVWDINLK